MSFCSFDFGQMYWVLLHSGRVGSASLFPRTQFFQIGFQFFQAFVIEGKTFDDVFAQPLRGPNAELGAPVGVHAVADGNYQVEVVIINQVCFPIGGSCCIFCNYLGRGSAPENL